MKKSTVRTKREKSEKKPISRLNLVILSFITAVVLWVVIVQTVNPDIVYEIKDIPVKVIGEGTLRDRGIVLMNKEELPEFNVKISGKRSEVISAMDRVRVNVDVSQVTRLGSFAVTPTVYVPSSITVEQQNISDVTLNFEECTSKEVPVVAGYTGLSKNKVIEVIPKIDKLTVTGAVSRISKLAKCIITVDASNIDKEFEGSYSFVYSDENGKEIEDCQTFFCNISEIGAVSRVYDKVQIPFKIESDERLKRKYAVELEESGSGQFVEGGLRTGSDTLPEVKYIIQDGTYNEGQNEFTAVLSENPDVFIPQKSMTVYGRATKLRTKRVHINIEPVNMPEGMTISFDHSITAELTMPVNTLEPVAGFIDLTGMQPGEHNVPVVFEDDKIFGDNITVKVVIT